jgi:translation initiation factor 1
MVISPMADTRTPFHNPFAAIAHLRGDMSEAPTPPDVVEAAVPGGTRSIARAVVRMERSGRGGKEVTVVEHLGLSTDELGGWLKVLKTSLGCGGTVEDAAIVLQGDQRKRLPALLAGRGVKRVTVA